MTPSAHPERAMRLPRNAQTGAEAAGNVLPQIANVIASLDSPGAGKALDALVGAVAPVDCTSVIAYPNEGNPVLLHDGMGSGVDRAALSNYLRGTYLLDAVYQACVDRRPEGLYRLRDLAPDDFFQRTFNSSSEVHPCVSIIPGTLAEEIVFLAATGHGTMLAYSLMRRSGKQPFSGAEFAGLVDLSPVIWERLINGLSFAEIVG